MEHILNVDDIKTEFFVDGKTVVASNNVSFYIDSGETVGIVGESGSGKSVTQLSLLKLISAPGKVVGGTVKINGIDISDYPAGSEKMRNIRGGKIGMIFQEPMTSLNPLYTIGRQITESIKLHLKYDSEKSKRRAIELLTEVGIPDAEDRFDYYPHQFSGGMRQRVMIAMVLAAEPEIIIADEATTALDVTMQSQILELLKNIVRKRNLALFIITHNLGIVARYADRIYVMYAGNVVEEGDCLEIFKSPVHPYTKGLLKAIPRLDDSKERVLIPIDGMPPNLALRGEECMFLPRCLYAGEKCKNDGVPELSEFNGSLTHKCACYYAGREDEELSADSRMVSQKVIEEKVIISLEELSKSFITKSKVELKAVEKVSFKIRKGETVGVVGESGCGKTTLAKTILKLYEPTSGRIIFNGEDITGLSESKMRKYRSKMSMIFQDPFSSLDPRQTVGSIVGEPLLVHRIYNNKEEYSKRVSEILTLVGLSPELSERVPHEFSGGQRQRIGIARALASNPDFIICDEPISALDVSIQAQIINLLEKLQADLGLTYMFIAHDLSVVKHISDRIIVMYMGRVVEAADCDELYKNPVHPYTKSLLSAIPVPDPEIEKNRNIDSVKGEVSSLLKKTEGCVFFDRCPNATEACSIQPPLKEINTQHYVSCVNII